MEAFFCIYNSRLSIHEKITCIDKAFLLYLVTMEYQAISVRELIGLLNALPSDYIIHVDWTDAFEIDVDDTDKIVNIIP